MPIPDRYNPIWRVSGLGGAPGVSDMLRRMAATVKQWKSDADVRKLAERITESAGASEDYVGQSRAIHEYVARHIKYMRDPDGEEELKPPLDLLQNPYGDCDDMAVLVATLNAAIGHPVRLQAVGFDPTEYSHVFSQVLVGRNWV